MFDDSKLLLCQIWKM